MYKLQQSIVQGILALSLAFILGLYHGNVGNHPWTSRDLLQTVHENRYALVSTSNIRNNGRLENGEAIGQRE